MYFRAGLAYYEHIPSGSTANRRSDRMIKKKNNYVDNKKMYTALVKWRVECEDAELEHREKPRIPAYIGECLFHIATNMAKKYNFSRYIFKEEMVSDGLENAVAAVRNFDTEKSTNPFGYFSLVIHFAFIRRIRKEKKHLYTKYKLAQNMKPSIEAQMAGSIEEMPLEDILGNPYMMDLANSFEAELAGEKKPNTGFNVWKTKKSRLKDGDQK